MEIEQLDIRASTADDLETIMQIESLAFGQDEEAELVSALLSDDTAQPVLSLIAYDAMRPVGHILFSRVYLKESDEQPLMHILAPLAVIPECQGRGVGEKLVKKGLEMLKTMGTELVFVLGHESYYPKFGFIPDAKKYGFQAPYKIPEEHSDAWMYMVINKNMPDFPKGKIICADSLNNPKYWIE